MFGYYILDWTAVAHARVEDSPRHNEMYDWCVENCSGRYTWTSIYGHNRADGEPRNDAVTWGFEKVSDCEKFAKIFKPTWVKHQVSPNT